MSQEPAASATAPSPTPTAGVAPTVRQTVELPQVSRQAIKRRNRRANREDRQARADAQGVRRELLWTCRVGPAGLVNKTEVVQISSVFRPAVGHLIVMGSSSPVQRPIEYTAENPETTPRRWKGNSTSILSTRGNVVGKVRYKFQTAHVHNIRATAQVREAAVGVATPVTTGTRGRQRANRAAAAASSVEGVAPAAAELTTRRSTTRLTGVQAGRSGKEEEGHRELSIVLVPQRADGAKVVDDAFPGTEVLYGCLPASVFSTLASAAARLLMKSYSVDSVYCGCPSWANGKHYIAAVDTGSDPAWAMPLALERESQLCDTADSGGPKTWCDHDPVLCTCESGPGGDKTLLLGLCAGSRRQLEPVVVYHLVKKWGRVMAIVPNPAFDGFDTRVVDKQRIYTTKGDPNSLTFPNRIWFGGDSSVVVTAAKWNPWNTRLLRWSRVPLGTAFFAIIFDRTKITPPTAPTLAAAGMDFGQSLELAPSGSINGPCYMVGQQPVRLKVVEEAEMAAAGRPLDEVTFSTMHRTAVRAAREGRSETSTSEEAYSAASLAWIKIRRLRLWWAPWTILQEMIAPVPFSPGGKSAGNLRKVLALVALVLFLFRKQFAKLRAFVKLTRAWMAAVPAGAILHLWRGGKWLPLLTDRGPIWAWAREAAATWAGVVLSPAVALWVVLAAPVYEEWFKRLHYSFPILLASWELLEKWMAFGSAGVARHAPVAFMHLLWASVDYRLGVLLHAMHNATAIGTAITPTHWETMRDYLRGETTGLSDVLTSIGAGMLGLTSWGRAVEAVHRRETNWIPGVCAAEVVDVPNVVETHSVEAGWSPRVDERCSDRPMAALLGMTVAGAVPVVYRSCWHNEMQAIALRLGSNTIWQSDTDGVAQEWDNLHRQLRGHLKDFYWRAFETEGPVKPTPFDVWLSQYPGGAKKMLRQAKEDMENRGLRDRRLRLIKAFIKVELTPMTIDTANVKLPKPRLIQGRQMEITSTSGPTFHSLGKRLARMWSSDITTESGDLLYYFSGVSAEDMGKWYNECVLAGLEPDAWDVSIWDTSVGPGPHKSWRRDCLDVKVGKPTIAVLNERGEKHGYTRRGIKYTLRWQVCSGDGDTSVGNTAHHGKMWIDVIRNGRPPGHEVARVGLAGDNAICMRPAGTRPQWYKTVQDRFTKFGFRTDLEGTKEGRYAGEACSGRFWACEGTFVFGPKIGRVVTKTFWAVNPPSERKWQARLRGTALGLRDNCAHIPILRVVIANIIRNTAHVPAEAVRVPEQDPWKIYATSAHAADQETYRQMEYLYGVTKEQVDAVEEALDRLDLSRPTVVDNPILNHIVACDLDDV